MKKVYRYYSGETVWTADGLRWFIQNDVTNTIKPIKEPNLKRVALDITKV